MCLQAAKWNTRVFLFCCLCMRVAHRSCTPTCVHRKQRGQSYTQAVTPATRCLYNNAAKAVVSFVATLTHKRSCWGFTDEQARQWTDVKQQADVRKTDSTREYDFNLVQYRLSSANASPIFGTSPFTHFNILPLKKTTEFNIKNVACYRFNSPKNQLKWNRCSFRLTSAFLKVLNLKTKRTARA